MRPRQETVRCRRCMHLRVCREPWISDTSDGTRGPALHGVALQYLRRTKPQNGRPTATDIVCQECFEYATTEIGDPEGVRGKPEIRIVRSLSISDFGTLLCRRRSARLSIFSRLIRNLVPLVCSLKTGVIVRFDADTGEWRSLASVSLASEPDHKPWGGSHPETASACLAGR